LFTTLHGSVNLKVDSLAVIALLSDRLVACEAGEGIRSASQSKTVEATVNTGMTRTVSKHHDRLARAVASLVGRIISAADVKAAYAAAFPDRPDDVQFVLASDHCSNQTNKGACECAKTARAVFERVGRGRYRALSTTNMPGCSAPSATNRTPSSSIRPGGER
jgi:hypothetical protein